MNNSFYFLSRGSNSTVKIVEFVFETSGAQQLRYKNFSVILQVMAKVNRDHFYKLASDLPEERLQAAVGVIKDLSALEVPQEIEEWNYTINRLVKGLGSSRNSARLGFSMCLSEALNLALSLGDKAPEGLNSIENYLKILNETLGADFDEGKKRKGKDERGILFGKLFGLQALLNEPLFSNVFVTKDGISNFVPVFVQEMINLSKCKNWIREPALFSLYQTLEKLISKVSKSDITNLISQLDENNLTMTNEGLAIYLLLVDESNKISRAEIAEIKLKNQGWKSNDPLAKGNLPSLTKVLLDNDGVAFAEDNEQRKQKGGANWNPRLHFVWEKLLSTIINGSHSLNVEDKHVSKKRKKNNTIASIKFHEFWQMVVDETYFNDKASSERKYLGFLIFQKAFPMLKSYEDVVDSLGQNFIRSLINQCSEKKRHLNKIALQTVEIIVESCENDTTKILPVFETLAFGKSGSITFDRLSKTKLLSRLLGIKSVRYEVLSKLFDILSRQLSIKSEEKSFSQFILDSMLHLVRNHKAEVDSLLLTEKVLPQIVKLAFFTGDNETLQEMSKERLFSILSELNSLHLSESQEIPQYVVIKLVQQHIEGGEKMTSELDDELKETESSALRILAEIAKATDKPYLRGLGSLFATCLLQLYTGDSESVGTLQELKDIYEKLISDDERPLSSITEILLSLLAQKKALLKKASIAVWEQVVPYVSQDELNLLLDILLARENKQGFAQLFEGIDEYEEDEDDEQLEDEEQIKEVTDDSSSNSESDSEEDEDNSDSHEDTSSDSVEDHNDAVNNIDKETTSALAKALDLPADIINANGEVDIEKLEMQSDDDDEDEDDESMDDEQMMDLDDQLSEIFKRRKEALSNIPTGNKRKNEVKESRESVIAFKHRIVDLLLVYIKHVEKMIQREDVDENSKADKLNCLLTFAIPMIKCIKQTLDKSLAEKLAKLLKTRLFKIRVTGIKLDTADVVEDFQRIHQDFLFAKPGQFPILYYSVCSSTSLYFSKILVDNADYQQGVYETLVDTYSTTIKEWLKDTKFPHSIFLDFVNWLASKKQGPKTN